MSELLLAENGTITVVLLEPLRSPHGTGSWAAGERAGFEPAEARRLVGLGVARFLTDAEQRATAETRARLDREEYQQRIEQGLQIPPRLQHLAVTERRA